jgi:hypothetical protein
MEQAFNLIDLAQKSMIKLHEGLTIQQLNHIPKGFNNNLVWNFAHAVASMQMLCYVRPGLQMRLNESFVNSYKIGTKPETFVTIDEYNSFKELATEGLDKLKEDYQNNYFDAFKPFTTGSGIEMRSFDFVLRYVGFHFGMHQGMSIAIKKMLN